MFVCRIFKVVVLTLTTVVLALPAAHASVEDEWRALSGHAVELYEKGDFKESVAEYARAAKLVRDQPNLSNVFVDLMLDIARVEMQAQKFDAAEKVLKEVERTGLYKSNDDPLLEARYFRRLYLVEARKGNLVKAFEARCRVLAVMEKTFSRNSPVYLEELGYFAREAVMAGATNEAESAVRELKRQSHSGVRELEETARCGLEQLESVVAYKFKLLEEFEPGKTEAMVRLMEVLNPLSPALAGEWLFIQDRLALSGNEEASKRAGAKFYACVQRSDLHKLDLTIRSRAIGYLLRRCVSHFEQDRVQKADIADISEDYHLLQTASATDAPKIDGKLRYQVSSLYAASLAVQGRLRDAEAVMNGLKFTGVELKREDDFAPAHIARHLYIAGGYQRLNDVAGVKRQYAALRRLIASAHLTAEVRARALILANSREAQRLLEMQAASQKKRSPKD